MSKSGSKSNYLAKVVWPANEKWIVDDLERNETFENANAG
jgi:hypothetical protein